MELIEKSEVLEILEKYGSIVWTKAGEELDSLPVHLKDEYEIGEFYEFSDDWWEWSKRKFVWYEAEKMERQETFTFIRHIKSESPEILSAKKLLEESGYSVTKK